MNGEQEIGIHNSALKSAAAVVVDKPRLALALKTLKEKVLEWFTCSAEGNLTVVNKHKLLWLFKEIQSSLHSWLPYFGFYSEYYAMGNNYIPLITLPSTIQ